MDILSTSSVGLHPCVPCVMVALLVSLSLLATPTLQALSILPPCQEEQMSSVPLDPATLQVLPFLHDFQDHMFGCHS